MLVLHLGMPKTGTSVVQNCLTLYACEEDAAIVYPTIGRTRSVAHHELAIALRQDGPASPLLSEFRESLRTGDKPVVISSEAFANLIGPGGVEKLSAFVAGCNEVRQVRCVLAVREIRSFLESMYLQSTRVGRQQGISPESYAESRLKWIEYFFEGVASLRRDIGNGLQLPMVVKGFDSVRQLEDTIGLMPDTLGRYKSQVPSTAKLSLKAEIALFHLVELEETIGRPLSRRGIISKASDGAKFEDDIYSYTLIGEELTREIRKAAARAAVETGFTEYLDAFADIDNAAGPVYPLDLSRLTAKDIELLATLG